MDEPVRPDPVLSLAEAEREIGLNRRTLVSMSKRGLITVLKISERRRGIRRSEVERYLASREPVR